jgi:sirohydrochlorin cobaltochelatase
VYTSAAIGAVEVLSSRLMVADLVSDGMAGRLVLVVDAAVPTVVQQACADLAATLADQSGLPVTVAAVPIARLDALEDSLRRDAEADRREYPPVSRPDPSQPMAAAPFRWRDDGRPDWGSMWTSFCELALFGGPPHRGPESPLLAPTGSATNSDAEMLAEMRRGIWETTALYAESTERGRISVACDSPTMAAWMCAAIILENVDARMEDDRLLLPAGPGYTLKNEVKSIITVVAKTHHYWQAHVTGTGRGVGSAERV